VIGGTPIPPGERITLDLPVARLYTHAPLSMPVHVVHGRRDGPRLFVSAAIHGDEINGVEVIRRLLRLPLLRRLRGALLAVPVVNVHGFINRSRYLPDRRDLNRSFPGSERGSLAARLADLFLSEIVANATHGIDLHTGALYRSNLPQVRAHLGDPETARLAHAFEAPVVLDADLRDGSLRAEAVARGIPVLLYEAGEALRFDELAIRAGVKGIVSVMRALGMLPASRSRRTRPAPEPVVARASTWVRAPESGVLRAVAPLGARVAKGDVLGMVSDPFGERESEVASTTRGIIIGRLNLPLVSEGEALFNIAQFERLSTAVAQVEAFTEAHQAEPDLLPDEPPLG
jgi:predicted deacylase